MGDSGVESGGSQWGEVFSGGVFSGGVFSFQFSEVLLRH
jgi:hypothetical protein